jgi:hypothetical protein
MCAVGPAQGSVVPRRAARCRCSWEGDGPLLPTIGSTLRERASLNPRACARVCAHAPVRARSGAVPLEARVVSAAHPLIAAALVGAVRARPPRRPACASAAGAS